MPPALPSAATVSLAAAAARRPLTRSASSHSKAVARASQPTFYLGPTHTPRLLTHYNTTLAPALLYLNHVHRAPPKARSAPSWDPTDPYTRHRPPPRPRGNRDLLPLPTPTTAGTNVRLERIVIHTMVKEAIGNKGALLSAIMALRSITGASERAGGDVSLRGVEVIKAKHGVAQFKIRAGMPVSVQIELTGERMYDFIDTLVEFVLPRMREFGGIPLPSQSENPKAPAASGGVVQFGLPPSALQLFPQVEVAYDSYPRGHGIDIKFVTNVKGRGAQAKARALLSGFRVPFVPR